MEWFYLITFLFGLIFGSFLNAYFWRVRENKSIWTGRSICTKCKNKIKWFDNIPIVSFLILRAKCRSCRRKISWQYPLVELWMGLVFVFVYYHISHITYHIPIYIPLVVDCFIIWFLTLIFLYDLKYQEILDRFTLIPAGILFIGILIFQFFNLSIFPSVASMLVGAGIASGFFLAQFLISKGRWIGGGDIRLGVLMGVILGWKLTILALFLAYIIGAVIGIILLIFSKKKFDSQIAFGTFLTVATFICMFWGDGILNWYFRLIM